MAGRNELVTQYLGVIDNYRTVVDHVVATISERLMQDKVVADAYGREKDPWSLATKLLKKEREGRGYASLAGIPDLAAARVVANTSADIPHLRKLVHDLFPGAEEDDKSATLGASAIGYRGIHFQVKPKGLAEELADISCEIQLRTRAEHLWSELSHELFYKTPGEVPLRLLRRFNRLIALVELFDSEVEATMNELARDPSNRWRQIYSTLEHAFLGVMPTVVGINKELSLELIESMGQLETMRLPTEMLDQDIQDFVDGNREKLRAVYQRHLQIPGRNPIVMQPESILVWFLLEKHRYRIMDEWMEHDWDVSILDELSTDWGVSVVEE